MTLALLITAATGAWADNLNKVKYALTAGQTISAGTTVDVKDDDGNVVATITYSEAGGNDFTTKATSSTSALDGYTAFTEGNGTNGEQTGGTFYTIVPVCDGTIDVAVVLNADKPFYILEDGTALEGYNGKTVDSKYYGTFTFNVKADKTYKIYAYNSKVGIYGFEFTYEPITWVYPTANTNEWTFQMPDNDVIVAVKYYPGRLTFGAATEGGTVEIEGMSDNKMPKGFEKSEKGNIYVEEGTTFIVKAVPAEGFHFVSWSDDAENTSLVRTITMGEENLELSATFSNEYDITFNAANANTIEGENGKATVTVKTGDAEAVDKTADIDENHQLKAVKMGSTVTITTKEGYKFRKVEVKKKVAAPDPTLAETLTTAGMTVKVNYNYGGENYCTFVSNGDGTYTFQSGGGYVGGDDNHAKALVVENGKLVFKQNYSGYWDYFGFSVTFDTSNNTYIQWKGEYADDYSPSFISVEVNGTQIAVTRQ